MKVNLIIECDVPDVTGDGQVDLSDLVRLASILETAQTKVTLSVNK